MLALRQAHINASVDFPLQSNKTELHALYASFQPGAPPSNSTPQSKVSDKESQVRSVPYPWPEQTTTPLRTGLQPSGCSIRPSASLCCTLDATATRPQTPPQSAELQLAAPLGDVPAFISTSCHDSVNTPLLVAQTHPQPFTYPTPNPLPYPLPAAPPPNSSTRLPLLWRRPRCPQFPFSSPVFFGSLSCRRPKREATSANGTGPGTCRSPSLLPFFFSICSQS